MRRFTDEDQLALAAQRGDRRASNELFRRLLPLVKWIAFRYRGPDRDDLLQAGSVGFMHALRTWKPRKGAAFKTWMTFWCRAYAARATEVHAARGGRELLEDDERDVSDEGATADEMTHALWRRQAHGLIDGMKDRRLAIVLQGRMLGQSLQEVAEANRVALGVRANGREWVRQLEKRALEKATRMARCG